MILRARLILPISAPPIQNGAVLIQQNRMTSIGRSRDIPSSDRSIDLGDVILMPGLINAHCHLDYTHMAGEFAPPRLFTDWLKLITTAKSHWTVSEYRASWHQGAQMLLRSGVTTVADIEAMPELLPGVWDSAPLRVHSFVELIGITGRRQPSDILRAATERLDTLKSRRCVAGLSPHAPYSTLPELLNISAKAARKRRWRLCVHVAESAAEYEMFVSRKGPMFDWLKRSRIDMSDCGLGTPLQHLDRHGALGPNVLAVHANYLGRKDPDLLAARQTSVVHCPRSHAFFHHEKSPLRRLHKAGVNICLGTDSLATVFKRRRQTVELNLFEEMRALQRSSPWLSPSEILRMATANGAQALGLSGKAGELCPGAFADLIAIPFTGKTKEAPQAVAQHHGPVAMSMIDGRWVIKPIA
jgi:cytosine/adenosine deaminase-related metal-dependent hydrolase